MLFYLDEIIPVIDTPACGSDTMNSRQSRAVHRWFHQYVDSIRPTDDKIKTFIDLKREHSLIVAGTCRSFAGEMEWTPDEQLTAGVTGLLHDIGRFSQLVEFRTFDDDGSIDHGERGYRLMKENGVLSTLSEHDRTGILLGIRHHNSRYIPPLLDESVSRYLKLVRDADKLDIIRVIYHYIKNGMLEEHPEITLNIDLDGPVTPEALEQVRNGETITYGNIKSLADFALAQLAWFYDINYPPAFRSARDRRVIDQIIEFFPSVREIDEVRKAVERHIDSQTAPE